ncbi:UNVERIFIED_CONTAM: hypothetical protein HDU68_002490 [Siphonaria sp. JEL0065]|nr:hypothetical protein HDU68_002490 [Siphonaria sp. JEL0065]
MLRFPQMYKTSGVLSTRLSKVHVHCPGVIVNETTAKHLFTLIRDKLAPRLQISDAQEITEVFDESVYKSGLRMLGSWKPSGKRDKDPDWVPIGHRLGH